MSTDDSTHKWELSRRALLRKGAITTTLLGFGAAGLSGSAAATNKDVPEDAIPIDGPTTITEPGYYVLTRDITASDISPENRGAYISILDGVSNVTIDGRGNTLDGDGNEDLEGIGVGGSSTDPETKNITIKNLCVTNFDSEERGQAGIECSVIDSRIQNVKFTNCETSINVNTVKNLTIKNCLFKKNDTGVITGGIIGTEGLAVIGNRFVSNELPAFFAEDNDLVLEDNHFERNGSSVNILTLNRNPRIVGNPTIVGNVFVNNAGGLLVISPDTGLVRGNRIIENRGDGLLVSGPADGPGEVLVEKNDILRNKGRGVFFESQTQGVTLRKNTIEGNQGEGVFLQFSSNNNKISKNVVSENRKDGIVLVDSDENKITKNTIRNNNGDGIELRTGDFDPDPGSNNNVIRKNRITGNGGFPIRIDDESTGNVVEDNKTDSSENENSGDGDHGEGDKEEAKEDKTCRVDSH